MKKEHLHILSPSHWHVLSIEKSLIFFGRTKLILNIKVPPFKPVEFVEMFDNPTIKPYHIFCKVYSRDRLVSFVSNTNFDTI